MIKVDYVTGRKVTKENKTTIYEAFIKNSFKSDANNILEENKTIDDFENKLY